MNPAAHFKGAIKALGRGEDWVNYFDQTRKGLQLSFVPVFLSLLFYYAIAMAVQENRAALLGGEAVVVPLLPFVLIFTLYALAFSVTVYILTMIFDKQDRFRPWVIVRHWVMFFAVAIAAAAFGLVLAGLIPFNMAMSAAFVIYLATLVIDIRLAQKIAGFEWGAAIITACITTAMGLTILLTGIAQFI